ncbi:hypothetical protein DYB25_010013 [Aphanomyces astaci]|uniref:histone acetyltransferase n=2 Tax=Aphanomyces astaci TaxID=112090 RepID=A0A396ZQC2_APHAT|nr:hypothetical protein DYB25_010013 [Aphanomyces astaci]RHY01358.1 hypothetical protein DYB36_004064 [Aphanomyces astaci]RHY53613.1 hypothetical protein DYB34_011890 [Aphanomyces astaci]RHY77725.1 hypothetical protein DYB38_011818 [Aphanomyces astaci]RHY77753.1 hypothetical protein DYB30_014184 [Aphanomyces astaci]
MATPEERKLHVYNEALMHASTCRLSECFEFEGRCQKIRSSIHHFLNCYTKRRTTSRIDEIEECVHCAKIFRLLCFHASHCTGSNCVVHMCNYLRRKIEKSTPSLPVVRQESSSSSSAWPHTNGEEIHGIYNKYL